MKYFWNGLNMFESKHKQKIFDYESVNDNMYKILLKFIWEHKKIRNNILNVTYRKKLYQICFQRTMLLSEQIINLRTDKCVLLLFVIKSCLSYKLKIRTLHKRWKLYKNKNVMKTQSSFLKTILDWSFQCKSVTNFYLIYNICI